jgi:hypothetical protein
LFSFTSFMPPTNLKVSLRNFTKNSTFSTIFLTFSFPEHRSEAQHRRWYCILRCHHSRSLPSIKLCRLKDTYVSYILSKSHPFGWLFCYII